jgi:hypothetical protein
MFEALVYIVLCTIVSVQVCGDSAATAKFLTSCASCFPGKMRVPAPKLHDCTVLYFTDSRNHAEKEGVR